MRLTWKALSTRLNKTRQQFNNRLKRLFSNNRIDPSFFAAIEKQFLEADLGTHTTEAVLKTLKTTYEKTAHCEPEQTQIFVWQSLHTALLQRLLPYERPLQITHQPTVILLVGMNGAGKTTTLAKLAHTFKKQGRSVLLAAGDTFRAAAVEQLQVWGERLQIPVIAQHTGADSASVLFDAFQSARAKHTDILLADTAGRLHTKQPLMEELKKMKRVLSKLDPAAPHEIWLVIDACTGQNALQQAQEFHKTIGLTGFIMTKLDGTAKGGMIFSVSAALNLPLYFIGVGEHIEDLTPFSAKTFTDAFLDHNPTDDAYDANDNPSSNSDHGS
jgi:fused signal recognition particle receptor